MFSVKTQAIEAFLEAARNTFPNEFIGMLAGNKKTKTVEELVVVPAIFGETFSQVYFHMLPLDESIIGTCHSHPSFSNRPSPQDVHTFSKTGMIHFIACRPYSMESVRAFDQRGKEIPVKII